MSLPRVQPRAGRPPGFLRTPRARLARRSRSAAPRARAAKGRCAQAAAVTEFLLALAEGTHRPCFPGGYRPGSRVRYHPSPTL